MTNITIFSWKFSLLLLFSFGISFFPDLKADTFFDGNLEINFKNLSNSDRAIARRILRDLNQNSGRFVPENKKYPPIKCFMFFQDAKIRGNMKISNPSAGTVILYLPSKLEKWADSPRILSKILAVRLLCMAGVQPAPDAIRTVPRWITTGIIRTMKRRYDQRIIPGAFFYPGLYVVFNSGSELDILKLIDIPLYPKYDKAFLAYEEFSEALYNSVLRLVIGKREITAEFIRYSASSKGKESRKFSDFFSPLFKKPEKKKLDPNREKIERLEGTDSFGLEKKLLVWIANDMRRNSVNYFTPATAEYSKILFENAQTVNYFESEMVDDEEVFSVSSCRIEELSERWDKVSEKKLLISLQNGKFLLLIYKMPSIFEPSLRMFLSAFSYLEKNEKEKYAETIAKAKDQFNKAFERRKALEKYLEAQENKFVPPGIRYENLLEAMAESDYRNSAWSALNAYLDKINKEFNE